MIYKLRKLVVLEKGYDPDMRNLDQSPFHINEAGSQVTGTIALQGGPIIPLIIGGPRSHEGAVEPQFRDGLQRGTN